MGKFLLDLKKEFGRGDNKIMKVVELKKVEQGSRIIEEFVQEFRRITKESKYEERPLVEKFKREMNGVIKQKLMELEYFSRSIEQLYERVTNLDKYWRKSRREVKKLRDRKEIKTSAQRTNTPATTGRE